MKKKILFLSKDIYFHGGAEKSLFDLMTNPGISSMLIVHAKGEMYDKAKSLSIPVEVLDFGKILQIKRPLKLKNIFCAFRDILVIAWKIRSISKKNNIDIVHSNDLKTHGIACMSRLMGGMPVFSHFRSIPFTSAEKIFWKAVQLIATRLILVSRPCWPGETLPSNVKVIFNGIEINRKIPPKRKRNKTFTLGFVGRIQFTKGVDTLIEWFDYAYKKGLDIKLLIRGEPAPEDIGYDQKARQMVKDRGLEKVCIFEGQISGLEKIYAGLDVNIVSSVVPDPLPRSVMEACALGIPVLGYPAGGIPYMFKDKKSGFLVENEEQFFEIIQQLMNDKKLYDSISKEAFKNAKENFALSALHSSILEEYNTI